MRIRCEVGWRLMALVLLLLALASPVAAAVSPDGVWLETVPAARAPLEAGTEGASPWVQPAAFRLYALDATALARVLDALPPSGNGVPGRSPAAAVQLSLPAPDGTFVSVIFDHSPVMTPELAQRYPDIRTYAGFLAENPAVSVSFDWTPNGFHAQVLGGGGDWYIDPYVPGESYAVYYKRDYRPDKPFSDFSPDAADGGRSALAEPPLPQLSAGATIRRYRLAVACTGEYAQFHCGGTCPNVNNDQGKTRPLAAIATTVGRVNQIYRRELAIEFQLVANNDRIVYVVPDANVFANANTSLLASQSQTVIDAQIGDANYDIGHTFSTGAGGMAFLGTPCAPSAKAKAVTGLPSPRGDAYDIDFVCHEMGHQFNADHTFNGKLGNCTARDYAAPAAYEPGSGATIMSYCGQCADDNLQGTGGELAFHSATFDAVQTFVNQAGTCYTASGQNAIPAVQAGSDLTIPRNTPFLLTGTATDADGDPLTFAWEEMDRSGLQASLGDADDGKMPLFRPFPPSAKPTRFFPRLETLAAGLSDKTERLPQVARTMTFRLVARDGKGGVSYGMRRVTVDATSGPFRLIAPSAGASVSGTITVAWDKANTDRAPVNASQVDIYLSTDGGYTFDLQTPLRAAAANTGYATVTLPNVTTSRARLLVKGTGNAFFAISEADFRISGTGGSLSVSPAYGLLTSGEEGGAFQGTSIVYTLQNQGSAAIAWTAAKNAVWVTLSATGGTLQSGQSATVTVSVDANSAKGLARDLYEDAVTFTNATSGAGTTVRPVSLRVGQVVNGEILVLEADGLTAAGNRGGPFTPAAKTFTLRNRGTSAVNWTAGNTTTWLNLSPATGTLAAGAVTTVTATLTEQAKTLGGGAWNDVVTFANTTNGIGEAQRPVTLNVIVLDGAGPPGGGSVLAGDVDGDGSVGLSDAVAAARVLSGSAPFVRPEADVDYDGKIGLAEFLNALQMAASLRPGLDGAGDPIEQQLSQKLNDAIANSATHAPGAVVLIRNPNVNFVAAAGKSNLPAGTAMAAADLLRIASMTKTFVSVAVIKLAEEGKLSLDDKVRQYIPRATAERIANHADVTIRQLLNMSSGLYEYVENEQYHAAAKTRTARWTPEEILTYVYDKPASFPAGTAFRYTNTNYVLLELVVNNVVRAAGSTLAGELRRVIFTPLSMANTFMEMQEPRQGGFGGLLVRGYDTTTTPPTDITEINDGLGLGDGGLISDVQGMAAFLRALFKQKSLLNEASLTQMKSVGIAGSSYGLGLEVKSSSAHGEVWGHSGKTGGFQGEMRYYPARDLTFIVLTNEENGSSNLLDVLFSGCLDLLYPPPS